ncbi:MAG: glycoside hydrolase family 6 protein [Mycobacteriales bacterium]
MEDVRRDPRREFRQDPSRPRRGRTRLLMGLVVGLVVLLVAGAAGAWLYARANHLGPYRLGAQAADPFAERPPYVYPGSRAAQAAAQARADGDTAAADVFGQLAAVPSGIWLTPEEYPPGKVGPFVASVVADADKSQSVPLLVVYGIPDRDCSGGYSSGGLSAQAYGPWVQEIATAAGAAEHAAVVVEPDALAGSIACHDQRQRVRLVRDAVDRLRAAGVTTYVDAGHSDWVSARTLAPLLRAAGVRTVRGFATNVANYQTDDDERAYAERLRRLVGGGVHYLIDSGRNGNGSTRNWCNPSGRALGTRPGFVADGTGLDAFAWVKPPGESDGECGGGPPAGEFWPARALAIVRASAG